MRADPCSKQVKDFITSLPCLSTHRTLRFLVGGPFPEEQATRVVLFGRTGELCRASSELPSYLTIAVVNIIIHNGSSRRSD